MFCNNCGTQNAEGVKFCSNCGAPLQSAPQQTTVLNQQPVQQNTYSQANYDAPVQLNPQKKDKKGLIIGISVGAVALIAVITVVLAVVLGGKDTNKDKNNDADANSPSVKQEEVQKPAENPTENPTEKPTETKQELSYQETAIAFLKAFYDCDLSKAQSYSIVDIPGIFEDLGGKVAPNELQSLYASLEEEFKLESGSVHSVYDLYSIMGQEMKKEKNYTVTDVKTTSTQKLNLNSDSDRNDLIEDIIGCDYSGAFVTKDTYASYVDVDKISEAYRVDLKTTVKFDDGSTDESDSWFYVAKYNGKWCVVADPIAASM